MSLHYKTREFDEAVAYERLREVLASRGIASVWELREYGPEYEQDVGLFEPYYNGAEGYWSSGNLDWIIYASHESSVTVGGWLLPELSEYGRHGSRMCGPVSSTEHGSAG